MKSLKHLIERARDVCLPKKSIYNGWVSDVKKDINNSLSK